MEKLRAVSGKNMCKVLEKLGFEKIYGKGSHVRFRHSDGGRTVVPIHGNEKLGVDLFTEILKQIKISKEKFSELLD